VRQERIVGLWPGYALTRLDRYRQEWDGTSVFYLLLKSIAKLTYDSADSGLQNGVLQAECVLIVIAVDSMPGSGYAQYRLRIASRIMIIHIFSFSNLAALFYTNFSCRDTTAQHRIGLQMDLMCVCIRM
jgi:hypothetical protein